MAAILNPKSRRRGIIIIIIIIRNGAKTKSPQNFVWGLNNNSEKETQNSNTSPDNSRGDVIRNGANTICLPLIMTIS
jgi:hypothetical protein